jgi:hypothetical protein
MLFAAVCYQFKTRKNSSDKWLKESSHPRLLRAQLIWIYCIYIQFYKQSLKMLDCYADASGEARLRIEPSQFCFEDTHMPAACVAVVYLLVSILLPALLVLKLYQHVKARTFRKPKVQRRYGVFVTKVYTKYYWYQVLKMSLDFKCDVDSIHG